MHCTDLGRKTFTQKGIKEKDKHNKPNHLQDRGQRAPGKTSEREDSRQDVFDF